MKVQIRVECNVSASIMIEVKDFEHLTQLVKDEKLLDEIYEQKTEDQWEKSSAKIIWMDIAILDDDGTDQVYYRITDDNKLVEEKF